LIFDEKFFLELGASFAAIATVWIYGNRSRKAPIVGVLGQLMWWWLTISQEMWGLLPLNIVMLLVHLRNYVRMKKEDNTKPIQKTTIKS
jgi:O-antigen ligase|tara:strand:+ start:2731 stop:2997 length:267 start_codon:yes stop_codon:yes gene_type:complete